MEIISPWHTYKVSINEHAPTQNKSWDSNELIAIECINISQDI